MTVDAAQVPCPDCRLSSPPGSPKLGYWECPGCARSFFLRRCKRCQAVSHVSAQQRWHQRWQCVWCAHRNSGFSRLGDPAAATVADLVADIARYGLALAPGAADRQTQPIPILAAQAAAAALSEGGVAAPPERVTPPVELWAKPATQPIPTQPDPTQPDPAQPDPAQAGPRRWWRGRPAILAAAVLITLMAAPAAVLAAHASHMPHPAEAGPPRPRTSQQISVSAASVRTVYLHSVPGTLTIVAGTGSTVTLTGKLRWTGRRPAQAHTTLDRAAHLLRLAYRCAAGSPCTENYRLVVPGHTAVVLSQPSGQVLLDNLAGPVRITAANVNVTATGLRTPSLTATITSGQLTASFAAPPQQVSVTLSSAHAIIHLPVSVPYTVSTQVSSGNVQVGVPQAAQSSHRVTAQLVSSNLELQPS
jgi:hypothetical protein